MHVTTLVAKLAREAYARKGRALSAHSSHEWRFPTRGAAAEFAALFDHATVGGACWDTSGEDRDVTVDFEEGGAW